MEITRRGFTTAGAVACGASVLASGVAASTALADEASWEFEDTADVIIVGAGTAMMAAVKLAEAGKKVIVLEKRSYVGGEGALAGGVIYAALTPLTIEAGVVDERTGEADTIDSVVADIEAHAIKDFNHDLIKKIAEKGPEVVSWFLDQGVEFELYQSGLEPVVRGHMSHNGATIGIGSDLIQALEQACEALGVVVHTQTFVNEVLTDAQLGIKGVSALDAQGGWHYYGAPVVILNTGGTWNNKSLCMQYNPEAINWKNWGSGQSYGEGFMLADKFNPKMCGMGSWLDPVAPVPAMATLIGQSMSTDPILNLAGETMYGMQRSVIYINVDGARFMDESLGAYDGVGLKISAQPGGVAYCICDDTMINDYEGTIACVANYMDADSLAESGDLYRADTIEELAGFIGMDPAVVQARVDEWNAFCDSGAEADQFGRLASSAKKIETAPFYTWQGNIATVVPFGGAQISIDVDDCCRVRNYSFNQPIPGLYVVGVGTACAPALGHGYAGSGICLASGYGMGMIAADSILEYLG